MLLTHSSSSVTSRESSFRAIDRNRPANVIGAERSLQSAQRAYFREFRISFTYTTARTQKLRVIACRCTRVAPAPGPSPVNQPTPHLTPQPGAPENRGQVTDTRQTDGLMQANDELRCSGMTTGAWRLLIQRRWRERAAAPACQTAAEKRPGQWRRRQRKEVSTERSHSSGDRMIRKTRPKPERRSTEHPLNVGVAPHHGFKARALLRAPFTTNPAHLSARTPPRRRMRRWGGRCARGDSGEGLGAP